MVNYKVTLRLLNGDPEVQRFAIEDDKKEDYAHLQAKLVELYPKLSERIYQICWTDEEGDEVIINSDAGLKIALSEMSTSGNGLYKLTVVIRGRNKVGKEKASVEREGKMETRRQEFIRKLGELNDALCDSNATEEEKQVVIKANMRGAGRKGGKGRGGKRARSGARKGAKEDGHGEETAEENATEEEQVPEDSLEEMFVQLSSHGADYLRSLGEMISNALESLDSLVVEEEEEKTGEEVKDDKIKHALEEMKKMGYADDGGWLTQLLTSTDGDISKAMAVIKPENLDKKQD